jgi:hypothetical protein
MSDVVVTIEGFIAIMSGILLLGMVVDAAVHAKERKGYLIAGAAIALILTIAITLLRF